MLLLIFGDELFYYTTFKFICQPLSEVFSNFLFCGAPSCETALILYHIQSSLSSTFFKFFQKTFLWPLFRFQTSFSIISHPNSFVNPFSEVFQICFSWYLSYLCDSFFIISLSHRLVKYFLFKFLILPIDSWYLYHHISNLTPRAAPAVLPFCSVVFRDSKYIITPLPRFVKKIVFNIHVWIVWNCWKNKKAAAKATAQFQYLMINQYQP